jgi:hypothetical protein
MEERKRRAIAIAGMFRPDVSDLGGQHDRYLADAYEGRAFSLTPLLFYRSSTHPIAIIPLPGRHGRRSSGAETLEHAGGKVTP